MEQEASRGSAAYKKVAIEASLAAKVEAHHRARAGDRQQARRDLREKANAQVSSPHVARHGAQHVLAETTGASILVESPRQSLDVFPVRCSS